MRARVLSLFASLGALLALGGCASGKTADADADGVTAATDCDDADPNVHPGATEVCDGVDNDCDGTIDDATPDNAGDSVAYLDNDGDGWGDAAFPLATCAPGAGFAAQSGDCDDDDAAVNPDAAELCGGGDEDCDGALDDADDDVADAPSWYADADGDGAGDPATARAACVSADGEVDNGDDCDDTNPSLAPGAPETCDGIDQDCDGLIDDDDPDLAGAPTWYADLDGDGWGDPDASRMACAQPDGSTGRSGDCDDADAAVNPEAPEQCNGYDDNCDGRVDDADDRLEGAPTWYVDGDGDGYGTTLLSGPACSQPPGFVSMPGDCDDDDPTVVPGAVELCDGIDGDCNGIVDDDASDAATYYVDADGDGWGDPGAPAPGCTVPPGAVDDASDCDDTDPAVEPGATETCDDGVDQDCDGFERPCPLGASLVLGTVGDTWLGETMDDRGGHSISWVGDTNGDGVDEWMLGAYREDSFAARAGAVYLITTYDVGEVILDTAAAKITGVADGDHSGSAVSRAGDIDGDGYDDILVGAYLAAPDFAGAAYLVHGPLAITNLSAADATFPGEDPDDQAGSSVSGGGDVDGDGTPDILVGAPYHTEGGTENGASYLIYGPVTGTVALGSADARILGVDGDDHSGKSVSLQGDLNGDGMDDLVVGAVGADDVGATYVVYGPVYGDVSLSSADARLLAAATGDQVGYSVSAVGDTDGDGYTDLFTGAPTCSVSALESGCSYLVRGPVAGNIAVADADATLLGGSAGDQAGYAVDDAGDFNGDGRADVLVGAWAEDETDTTSGATYVELGPFSGTENLADAYAKLISSRGGTESGRCVGGGGDIDGDGLDDIVIGAPDLSVYANGAGGGYLLLGADL